MLNGMDRKDKKMSWLTNIFTSSEKAVEIAGNIANASIAGIDKIIFTDEERAEMGIKRMQTWLEVQKALAEENSIRSITRRIVAVTMIGLFGLLLLSGAVLYRVDPGWSEFLLKLCGQMFEVVLLIVIFYFGWYGVKGVVGEAKK